MALGILSILSAMIMTGPLVYYAMAKDGIFFPRLAQVNPETRTPAPSIALGLLAYLWFARRETLSPSP